MMGGVAGDRGARAPVRIRTVCRRSRALPLACLVVVAALVPWVWQGDAAAEDFTISTGLGISITRVVRIKYASPFDPNPRYAAGTKRLDASEGPVDDGTPGVPADAEASELTIETNAADWGVAVRFLLPKGGEPRIRAGTVGRCRLLDDRGKVISEAVIDAAEVFLPGNGEHGVHTLFLEVSGHAEALGVETLSETTVDVTGWLAGGQE